MGSGGTWGGSEEKWGWSEEESGGNGGGLRGKFGGGGGLRRKGVCVCGGGHGRHDTGPRGMPGAQRAAPCPPPLNYSIPPRPRSPSRCLPVPPVPARSRPGPALTSSALAGAPCSWRPLSAAGPHSRSRSRRALTSARGPPQPIAPAPRALRQSRSPLAARPAPPPFAPSRRPISGGSGGWGGGAGARRSPARGAAARGGTAGCKEGIAQPLHCTLLQPALHAPCIAQLLHCTL